MEAFRRKTSRVALLFVVGGSMFWASCASRPVTESPALHGETLSALMRSALTSDELSETSLQTLRVLDLLDDWYEHPDKAPHRVEEFEGGQPDWAKDVARSEMYYLLGKRIDNDATAQRYYLEAVLTAVRAFMSSDQAISPFDMRQRMLAEIYNRGIARFLVLGQELNGRVETWKTVECIHGEYPLVIGRGEGYFDPEDFDDLLAADERSYSGRLVNRHREFGVGAPLIGVRRRGGRGSGLGLYHLPNLQALPITAALGLREGESVVRLYLLDPFRVDSIQAPQREPLPRAADFSAPLGHYISQLEDPYGPENEGLFAPEQLQAERGIYMMQPYDPDRIPLLLVHGLWSSPITWIEVINEIWGDDQLRKRYQIWQYLYPTGLSVSLNAASLRRDLDRIREDLDPELDDPAMQDMVVVGHSMGGILAKTLVSDSGDSYWNAVAAKPLDELEVTPSDHDLLKQIGFFEAKPYVRRVVFVASPHRGAPLADGLAGTFGDWLISLPYELYVTHDRITKNNPDTFPHHVEIETSIEGLSEGSVPLRALTEAPIREGVPFHTIVGDVTEAEEMQGYDGVVYNASSHLDGAESEVVLPYGHAVHRYPLAQLELRRILALHLEERAEAESPSQ